MKYDWYEKTYIIIMAAILAAAAWDAIHHIFFNAPLTSF
jgi:hypothetical protein